MMFTVVYTPRGVRTLADVYLGTVTLNVVQPNLSATGAVVVVRLRSNIPDSVASTVQYKRPATTIQIFYSPNRWQHRERLTE